MKNKSVKRLSRVTNKGNEYYCGNCGNTLDKEAKICNKCGYKIYLSYSLNFNESAQ